MGGYPDAVQVEAIGNEETDEGLMQLYVTRQFGDDVRSDRHQHREENLSTIILSSPDPSPHLKEITVTRSPHLLPMDEFDADGEWWERRCRADERVREAIPISHPAVRRPDSEDHPRECRLIKDALPNKDRYVDTSLVLGLMDFITPCSSDLGGILPVGLTRQVVSFLPNLEESLPYFEPLLPGDLMTLVVETSIGTSHIFIPIDRDHGEALGRRDAFEIGVKTALGEARRRNVGLVAVTQPPDFSRGSTWDDVARFYHQTFDTSLVNLEFLGGTDLSKDWIFPEWQQHLYKILEEDTSVLPYPRRWIPGLGGFDLFYERNVFGMEKIRGG